MAEDIEETSVNYEGQEIVPTNKTTIFVLFYEPDAPLIPNIIKDAKEKLLCYEKLVFVDDRDDKSFEIDFDEFECLDLGGHKGVYYARWYATNHCDTLTMRFVDADDEWDHGLNLDASCVPDIQIGNCEIHNNLEDMDENHVLSGPAFGFDYTNPSLPVRKALASLYGRYGLWQNIWRTEFLKSVYELYPVNENFFLHEDIMITTAAIEKAETISGTPTDWTMYVYTGPSETNVEDEDHVDDEVNEDELYEDTPTRIAYIQKLNKELGLKVFDSILIDGKLF